MGEYSNVGGLGFSPLTWSALRSREAMAATRFRCTDPVSPFASFRQQLVGYACRAVTSAQATGRGTAMTPGGLTLTATTGDGRTYSVTVSVADGSAISGTYSGTPEYVATKWAKDMGDAFGLPLYGLGSLGATTRQIDPAVPGIITASGSAAAGTISSIADLARAARGEPPASASGDAGDSGADSFIGPAGGSFWDSSAGKVVVIGGIGIVALTVALIVWPKKVAAAKAANRRRRHQRQANRRRREAAKISLTPATIRTLRRRRGLSGSDVQIESRFGPASQSANVTAWTPAGSAFLADLWSREMNRGGPYIGVEG